MNDIFNALRYTDYDDVRAVILGQDPYHGPGQAHGLCFSVQDGVPKPPSLVNIFKELQDDVGFQPPESGNLTRWAQNGVLLLNAVLTVRAGMAGSHAGMGWETLTDKIIALLGEREKPIVFLLWGGYARRKAALIPKGRHLILFRLPPLQQGERVSGRTHRLAALAALRRACAGRRGRAAAGAAAYHH